jgi:hypothetical protein
MKGKIKVSHVQEITLSFEESEKIDALTLAGKYIGGHGFKAQAVSMPDEDQKRGYIILIKQENAEFEKQQEPPKQATIYPNK